MAGYYLKALRGSVCRDGNLTKVTTPQVTYSVTVTLLSFDFIICSILGCLIIVISGDACIVTAISSDSPSNAKRHR